MGFSLATQRRRNLRGDFSKSFDRPAALLLVLLFITRSAFSQTPSGRVVGEVRERQNNILPGVSCLLSLAGNPSQTIKTTTDALGKFAFPALAPGSYTADFSLKGFQSVRKTNLELRPGSVLELIVNLAPSRSAASMPNPDGHIRVLDSSVAWGTAFGKFQIEALPNARNVGALLESQEPSTVTNRLDVGGLETGIPPLFGALGASWTENQYALNGFDVTDPYLPGRPLLNPVTDSLPQFQVTSGAKPAWLGGSGTAVMLTTPPTSPALHGDATLFYSGRSTQSDNMDARLRHFDFPGPERLGHLVDGNIQLGGKLPIDLAPWPAFISASTQLLGKTLGGFAAPIDVHAYTVLAELTPIARDGEHLNLLYSGQHIFNSREGAAPQIAPSATTVGNDNFHQFQARWDRTLSPNSLLNLGFGVVHATTSSGIQPGIQGASILDLPLLTQTGPAPLATAGVRTRLQANALYEAVPAALLGNHNLDLGLDWERNYISNRWDASGGLEQVLVSGVGAEAIRWNAPTQARQHVQDLAIFAQDAWRPLSWLQLPLGLRLETSSGRAVGAENLIHWTALDPRAGLVVPLADRGLVLRASWSRYGHLLQGRYLDFGNPAAPAQQVFRWQDVNGDGQVQPSELTQLLQVSGGAYSAIDRGLARPFTDEISVGLSQNFGARFNLGARFFRRDDHRLIALLNLGVPFSSYAPVSFLDPGNDGIPGTADDAILTLYNQKPSTLGRDFFLLTNPQGDRASYKGFEIRLVKPLVHLWEFSASFTGMQTLAPTSPGNSVFENDTGFLGSLYTNPNTLLFDTSRTYFDRAFLGKVTGYYVAPFGFRMGAVAKYYDGQPFGRLLFVNGFNQGPFFVRATPRGHPGGFQTQFNLTLDARVAREFNLRRGVVSGYLDCFNCLNMNRNTLEADLTGPTFQSRVPLAIEPPRIVRLGVEWRF
ncbi:MAG TPA: carboxypeptidase regulatory-like domain-containing protein [Terriglobia bacterium]|nr:carboxypeptidase regulatory-like domain-containing protein [Terriglobia bacterium]